MSSALLRMEYPKCGNGHELGIWKVCENKSEKHVFLSDKDAKCPYCGSSPGSRVIEGTKVKCLHVNINGLSCPTRPFEWFKEGPPCFMNHFGKLKVEE